MFKTVQYNTRRQALYINFEIIRICVDGHGYDDDDNSCSIRDL